MKSRSNRKYEVTMGEACLLCYRTNTEPVSLEANEYCEVKGVGREQIMEALKSHDQNFEFCSKREGEPLECL